MASPLVCAFNLTGCAVMYLWDH